MNKPHKVSIGGKKREIVGWNESGNLVLADGESFVVVPLDMSPATFRSLTLRAISTLVFTGDKILGEWTIDGQSLKAARLKACVRDY